MDQAWADGWDLPILTVGEYGMLSVKDLAARSGFDEATVYRHLQFGVLPPSLTSPAELSEEAIREHHERLRRLLIQAQEAHLALVTGAGFRSNDQATKSAANVKRLAARAARCRCYFD